MVKEPKVSGTKKIAKHLIFDVHMLNTDEVHGIYRIDMNDDTVSHENIHKHWDSQMKIHLDINDVKKHLRNTMSMVKIVENVIFILIFSFFSKSSQLMALKL